ncbi:DUF998 domain-containing protein [Halorarum salinum]|uniref:DUF998 domain-containing protein n=1 Tax=Halorarum salinum TaxID=2743089 RepID=A0A7D5LA43_9EURY|nr:DUF998 domain-containing protein [Halobaculum salinum]QLG61628.1 DUF998 domain-containing protein [Halobaculum salinum]
MATRSRSRPAAVVGAAAAVGTVLAILAAALVAPWFSWRADALSDLGVAPGTAPPFNGGLLLGGAFALPYAWALWRAGEGAGRIPAATFALSVVAMAGVGAFPAGGPLHFPAALAFYLLATATMAVDGLGRLTTTGGRAALVAAGLHLLVWAAWIARIRPGPGLALPELAGALLFVAWVVAGSPVAPLGPAGVRRVAR